MVTEGFPTHVFEELHLGGESFEVLIVLSFQIVDEALA